MTLDPGSIAAAAVAAHERLHSEWNPTPLLESSALNERLGGRVLLKPENLQRTGSFKIRGALNAVDGCLAQARETGVVAWSSGNHAQGIALAAALRGVQAHIVMPHDAPPAKRCGTERFGAKVVGYDRYTEDREEIARSLARSLGAPLIPSYDHPDVIIGQATVGVEIVRDPLLAQVGAPDHVLVCCGGGGLTAGISSVLAQQWPETKLYAVEPEAADDTRRSFESGERVRLAPGVRSVCDALLTPTPGSMTFPINRELLSGVLTVSDQQAMYSVGFARRELRLIVEPGGAVALAATLHGKIDCAGKTTVVVLSGGNIDDATLASALERFDQE